MSTKIFNSLRMIPVDLATITSPYESQLAADINDGGKLKQYNSTTLSWELVGAGSGDVEGPVSSTEHAIARYDDVSGKILDNSGATVDDNANITTPTHVNAFDVVTQDKLIKGDNSNFRLTFGSWVKYKNTTPSAIPEYNPGGTPDSDVITTRDQFNPSPNGSTYSMEFSKSSLSGNMQGNGAYLDVAIPVGRRNQFLTFKYLHSTIADYVSGDFKIFIRDNATQELVPIIGESDVPASNGAHQFSFYSSYASIRIYIHVVTTNSADSKHKNFTDFELVKTDLTSVPITQEQVINLAGSGNFTGGTFRIARAGNSITLSGLTDWTHASASSASSATGIIPDWARPIDTQQNTYRTYASGALNITINPSGTISTAYFDWAGNGLNQTNIARPSMSYTVDSQNTIQGLAVNSNPPVLNVSKTGGSTSGMSAIASWSAPTKNIGFTFNTTTGLATIPEDGDYHFGVDGTWGASQQVAYNPIVNGTPLVRYTSQANNPSGAIHNTGYFLLTNLKKGDTVGVGTTIGSTLALDRITFTLEYKPSSNTAIMAVPDAKLRVDGFSGLGSTNTAIGRFTTVRVNSLGSFGTYNSSSTLGDSVTINIKGRYRVVVSNRSDGAGYVHNGITVNASSLTSQIQSLDYASGFRASNSGNFGGAGFPVQTTWEGTLNVGDIVRPQYDTGSTLNIGAPASNYFEIEFLGWVS